MTYTEDQYNEALKITETYISESLALSQIEKFSTSVKKRTISKLEYDKAKNIISTYIKQRANTKNPQIKLL